MLKCDLNKVKHNFIEIPFRHGYFPVNFQHISEYLFIIKNHLNSKRFERPFTFFLLNLTPSNRNQSNLFIILIIKSFY